MIPSTIRNLAHGARLCCTKAAASVAALVCVMVTSGAAARTQLININFTNAPYSGTGETSPATPTGAAGTWNNYTNGTANGPDSWETDAVQVLLADGTPGPMLTLDMSSGSGANNVWNGSSYGSSPTTIDYTTAGGVYDVGGLYESGVVNGGNATTGFRVKGLAPGNYDVFVVPMFRGVQAAGEKADAAVTFQLGAGTIGEARNVGTYSLSTTATSVTQYIATNLTTWVAATDGTTAYNYIGGTVTIDSADRWLTILLGDSSTSGPDRPGPSVVQIRAAGGGPTGDGNFDNDDDVDGDDFLLWQRGQSPQGMTTPDLDLWRMNYGFGSDPGAVGVPEPGTGALTALAAAALGCVRRAGRSKRQAAC